MKKNDILKYLPRAKSIRNEANRKARMATKLSSESSECKRIADALSGIVLHDKFPLRLVPYQSNVEVLSGCDEVKRSAYVKPVADTGKFAVVTYRNDGVDIDGTPIEGNHTKATALRLAKEYVASGRKLSPGDVATPRKKKTTKRKYATR
jgi:hypothetical protein